MRIVHVSTVHPWHDIRIVQKMCRSLAESGHDVHLIIPGDEAVVSRVHPRLTIHLLPEEANRWRRFWLNTWRASRIARTLAGDIYHFHDPELLLLAWGLDRQGHRVVFDMHENTPRAIRTKSWIPAPIRRLVAAVYRRLEKSLLAGIPVVFAEQSYRKDYSHLQRTVVVQNFPDPALFRDVEPASPSSEFSIGYLGAVSRARGIDNVLAALAILHQQGYRIGFDCIGRISPQYKAACEAGAEAAGLAGVTFRGPMTPQAAWCHVAACDVGVAVLAPLENYLESFPTKMFEYMLLGLPVIVSDFPLYRKVVEEAGCGLLVPPQDPERLAAAIRQLRDDPLAAREMGRRGRAAVERRYNWPREFEKLIALYRELVPEATLGIDASQGLQ